MVNKTIKWAVSEPLAFSINQSMVASCMPDALKIIPLYKSKDAEKDRPISLLPSISKISENK